MLLTALRRAVLADKASKPLSLSCSRDSMSTDPCRQVTCGKQATRTAQVLHNGLRFVSVRGYVPSHRACLSTAPARADKGGIR